MSQAMQSPEFITHEVPSIPEESPTQFAMRFAMQKFNTKDIDWVTFFREVLGKEGIVRRTFKHSHELAAFERTPEFAQMQQMLAKLREQNDELSAETEPTRVITVRLPKSVHEYLKDQAHAHQTSMNKLCITRLLQLIDNGAGATHEQD